MAHLTIFPAAKARLHAPRLELATHRARRNLAIGILAWQPDLDVVGLLRGETHIAGAERHHPIMQIETAQHLLGTGQHALVLVSALIRRCDRYELDFRELMLANHAAGVLARRTCLRAKAGRQRA